MALFIDSEVMQKIYWAIYMHHLDIETPFPI